MLAENIFLITFYFLVSGGLGILIGLGVESSSPLLNQNRSPLTICSGVNFSNCFNCLLLSSSLVAINFTTYTIFKMNY
ncbi:MAG TPA: hypothetical protein DDW50_00425 [Firmicutes bacterium]|nr:hypothetical protein [Bacillota bacterium]